MPNAKKEEHKFHKSSRPREPKITGMSESRPGNFLSAEDPRRARELEVRVCRVFVQARVAKGQKVQMCLEGISTVWSFYVPADCPVTKP